MQPILSVGDIVFASDVKGVKIRGAIVRICETDPTHFTVTDGYSFMECNTPPRWIPGKEQTQKDRWIRKEALRAAKPYLPRLGDIVITESFRNRKVRGVVTAVHDTTDAYVVTSKVAAWLCNSKHPIKVLRGITRNERELRNNVLRKVRDENKEQ